MTQKIEYDGERIETGPIRIGDDWTGIFMRGDDALPTAMYLNYILEYVESRMNTEDNLEDLFAINMLKSHIKLLGSCVERGIENEKNTTV